MKWIYVSLLFLLSSCSPKFWAQIETQPRPVYQTCSYYDPYYGITRYTYCAPTMGYYTYPTYPYPRYYTPTVIIVKDKDKPKPNKYTPSKPTPNPDQRRSTGVDRSKVQSQPTKPTTPQRNNERGESRGSAKVEKNRSDVKN